MQPKCRGGVMLEYQEVLEVNLMTSATSYSNFNPQVAKMVSVDAFHHHCTDKLAADAIKQRWLRYCRMTASYLEILACPWLHILAEIVEACGSYLFKIILFKYTINSYWQGSVQCLWGQKERTLFLRILCDESRNSLTYTT